MGRGIINDAQHLHHSTLKRRPLERSMRPERAMAFIAHSALLPVRASQKVYKIPNILVGKFILEAWHITSSILDFPEEVTIRVR